MCQRATLGLCLVKTRDILMRNFLATVLAALLSSAAPQSVAADVVVELYTSQGCSSCPPADALLAQLINKPGVIPLSLHVDYWDYLGWKDEFGQAAFTDRQKRYAQAAGSTMIYTPQMVIGGVDQIVGTKAMELSELIMAQKSQAAIVALTARAEGDTLRIVAEPRGPVAAPLIVQLVRYVPEQKVKIQRGENAGRELTYHNVVMSWQVVGDWDGAGPMELDVPQQGDAPAVVILQQGQSGPILAAIKVD